MFVVGDVVSETPARVVLRHQETASGAPRPMPRRKITTGNLDDSDIRRLFAKRRHGRFPSEGRKSPYVPRAKRSISLSPAKNSIGIASKIESVEIRDRTG